MGGRRRRSGPRTPPRGWSSRRSPRRWPTPRRRPPYRRRRRRSVVDGVEAERELRRGGLGNSVNSEDSGRRARASKNPGKQGKILRPAVETVGLNSSGPVQTSWPPPVSIRPGPVHEEKFVKIRLQTLAFAVFPLDSKHWLLQFFRSRDATYQIHQSPASYGGLGQITGGHHLRRTG